MSRLHKLKGHIDSLRDIQEIMQAMKNIALVESRRLAQFIAAQQAAVANIERASDAFLEHFAAELPLTAPSHEIVLVIGSERGLCGNFNEVVMQFCPSYPRAHLLAVGSRLQPHLPGDAQLLPGPSTAEEVEATLIDVAAHLSQLENALPPGAVVGLSAIHHSDETNGVRQRRILPMPTPTPQVQADSGYPPRLNLPPRQLFAQLTEHYLFAALHEAFFSSLKCENDFRLQHMNQAVQRLDTKLEQQRRQFNAWRQEEITEEIEVIMLSVELLHGRSA